MGNKSPVTLQCLAAAKIINSNLIEFPISDTHLPWVLREQIWDLVSLKNPLAHKFGANFFYDKLEDEIYDSIVNLSCEEIRFQIRLEQIRERSPPTFDNPPPKHLFNIHHRKYVESKILSNLQKISAKIKSRGERAVQKMAPLLINLPPQYLNIKLEWCKEDMEDDEDEENRHANFILSLLRENDSMR